MATPVNERMSDRQVARVEIQMWTLRQYARVTQRSPRTAEPIVIDLGVEAGLGGWAVRQVFKRAKLWGVDLHVPEGWAPAVNYDRMICGDALDVLRAEYDRADVIMAAELIEHFPQARGRELALEMARRSELAILTSPLGFMPQRAISGNPYQVHVSGWPPDAIEALGYDVVGIVPQYGVGVYAAGAWGGWPER